MGIFSSKYVTQVGTVVSRLIEDSALPGSVKTGSIKALFNDGNLPEYVMEELVSSIGVRAERMYSYAEDNYVHGLPSGEIFSSTQGRQQVEAVIESLESQQVFMEYSHFGPPNTLHIGWLKLVSQYGYNQATNELATLTAQKGTPVYLKDMVVVVPDSLADTFELGSLDQWGTAASAGYTPQRLSSLAGVVDLAGPSPVYRSSTATELHLLVTYVWETQVPVVPATVPPSFTPLLNEASMTLLPSGYDDAADYFHAKYTVGAQTKYWMYKNDSGTYPTLDAVFTDSPVVSGEYFPFAYFRYNKQSVIADNTTPAYLTSKKMVKYLGLDYDLIAQSIDDNPDIADVEQAMLVMGVPASSTDPMECRYLFDYFDNLFYAMGDSWSFALSLIQSRLNSDVQAKHTIVIKDAQFKMALSNDGIYKRIVGGSIGPIGTNTSSYVLSQVTTEFVDTETGLPVSTTTPLKTHTYRRQIAVGLYEEITVRNLKMTYFIFEEYTTTGDETDDILLIPIDRTISCQYSISDREKLYARSLHFVFNSRVVTKIKWYQTGVFAALLVIIAIVITVYTYGADGGSLIATALGLSGTAGLVATIIVNLAIGQLFASGFKLFVKIFGAEVATALAVLAIVYGGYQVIQAGSVSGAPWAMELLQIANGLQQAIFQDKFSDLLNEAEAFKLFAEEETKLLDKANELLETSAVLSPFVIFGEKPEDFYNRTVHSGNIGILGINAVSSYVDIALTLPTLNDTLGEETYAT